MQGKIKCGVFFRIFNNNEFSENFFYVLWPTISKRNIIRCKIIQICTLKNDITLLRKYTCWIAKSTHTYLHTYYYTVLLHSFTLCIYFLVTLKLLSTMRNEILVNNSLQRNKVAILVNLGKTRREITSLEVSQGANFWQIENSLHPHSY